MANRKEDFPCIICQAHVKKNDKAVQCSLCRLWVHVTCEKMTEECFKILCNAEKYNGMYWSCRSCTAYAANFNQSIQQLNKRVTDLEGKISGQSNEIDDVKKDVDNIKADMVKVKELTRNEQEHSSTKIFTELRERENRKQNILVHNLAEPTARNKEERIKEDKVKLTNLCKQIDVNLDINTVKFMSRVGKFSEDKQRPLLVGFKDLTVKDIILDSAPKLNKLSKPWSEVNIIQDLTKRQRQEESDLKREADNNNERMTEEERKNYLWKVVGRRGERRVVKTTLPRPTPSQSRGGRRPTRDQS